MTHTQTQPFRKLATGGVGGVRNRALRNQFYCTDVDKQPMNRLNLRTRRHPVHLSPGAAGLT